MRYPNRRKISVGTKMMLVIFPLVLIGTILVLSQLFSGEIPDLSRAFTGAVSRTGSGAGEKNTASVHQERETAPIHENAVQNTVKDRSSGGAPSGRKQFSLTVAGTAAMTGDVRNSCYYKDVRVYDFSDTMVLLKPELRSDVNILFLENIIMDDQTVTDIVVPSSLTAMLKTAGFNMAACGFSGSWEKGSDGVTATRNNLLKQGIIPLGIYDPEEKNTIDIREIGGIPTAFLQYTDTIKASVRKKMEKQNADHTVPQADAARIRADIAEARKQGAKAVIVLLNWGKSGAKKPDKAQRELAQQIADAGADLIIGSGSRYPQTAEYLSGGDRQVLCVWSLGTTLSGRRDNADWLSGYLFHAEVVLEENGQLNIAGPAYTPVYAWKSKLSGIQIFRCMPSNREMPDGMDSDQKKTMDKTANITRTVLQESPLQER